LTVEEALPALEKSLDQALLDGIKTMTIIHGIGTGRLREAVRGFLHDEPRVKNFYRGEPRGGGEGVTMVELNND
ncbi:MAG: Smr/MutS family protein, partial [Deltaproteobacteria bacterium]|nr:Smr/MutS family protein [Deltaproteobacteria bacterium]